jgi:hypothetical protein
VNPAPTAALPSFTVIRDRQQRMGPKKNRGLGEGIRRPLVRQGNAGRTIASASNTAQPLSRA